MDSLKSKTLQILIWKNIFKGAPYVRNPPPTFRRHICQYYVPSSVICRKGSVLYIETIWPAWIFELGLLKFSHFVSNSLRNVQNDVQIFQFWLYILLNLQEKLIFEGVFCVNIFLNSFFQKINAGHFFQIPIWSSFVRYANFWSKVWQIFFHT